MTSEPEVPILLVDDRPENLLALEAILAAPDYRLVKAGSGEEALKCLLHEEFAVILLDVHMPGMDGFETARRIKEREKSRNIPIIFITAISKEERYVSQGYSLGAAHYLFKPFVPEVLKAKVAVFVELYRAAWQLKENVARLSRAEEAARKEKERLKLIIENVAEPILVTGPQNEMMLMNERMKEFLAYRPNLKPREEKAVRENNALFASFASPLILDGAEARKEDLTLEEPVSLRRIPFRITAVKIRDAQGEFFGVVSIFHDLTEVRELERRRLEKELFEMEKMAALGRLAAAMAHEINNPLEAILNSIYLVSSRAQPNDPSLPFLKIAEKEIERISRMIQEMLGLYRGGPVAPVEVSLILGEVLSLIEGDIKKREIDIVRRFAPTPPVRAGADQLKQVFLNLILNARNAMGAGPARDVLTLATRLVRRENLHWVEIEVRDTGRGIPKEALSQIFEPFYTAQKAKAGSGLGLWISREIIQSLRGTIRVESEEGVGTVFIIHIPAHLPAQEGRIERPEAERLIEKEEGRNDRRCVNERENLTGR